MLKDLDNLIDAAAASGQVPGVVAAVTDRSGVLYRAAAGCADVDLGQPMRSDAIFRIASMTKLVTTIAVLKLLEQGAIAIDAPLGRYLPSYRQPPVLQSFDLTTGRYETRPATRDITVRQLLTHTSGYGYWFLNPELRAVMGAAPNHYHAPFLVSEPGARFQYGISTDVLGQIIAPVTGLPLESYFAREIFAPLGMRNTGFDVPMAAGRLAAVHTAADGGGFVVQPNETQGEAPRGGGGLYSTADDYLALLRMLLNDGAVGGQRLLSAASVQALCSDQIAPLRPERQTTAVPARTHDFAFMNGSQAFGFGVLIETRDRPGGRSAGSYGWAGILNTYFWVDPTVGVAAVVCMQMAPFCAPACLTLCDAFEHALYRSLRD